MAEASHRETIGRRTVTLNGTVSRYDLIAHNGTNWVQADANDPTLYAQLVALQGGVSGDVVEAAPWVRLYDSDAPYTQDAIQYLSGTAGAHTETRPAAVGDLVQSVGSAISDDEVIFNILPAREVSVTLSAIKLGTAADLVIDTGPAAGVTLAAANDAAVYNWITPGNCVDVLYAKFMWSADVTLDASDTYSVSVSSAAAGEANDATTDSIAATALTVTADEVAEGALTTALDAAGIPVPGQVVSIDINKDAEGSAGDDPTIYGVEIVYKAV